MGSRLMAAVSVQNEAKFWPWIVVMAAQPPMRSYHCIAHVKMVKIASFDMHVTYVTTSFLTTCGESKACPAFPSTHSGWSEPNRLSASFR